MSEQARPDIGQSVTWLEQRKWGGKQNQPATYLGDAGRLSARIRLGNQTEKTVRLSSLQWERQVQVNGEPRTLVERGRRTTYCAHCDELTDHSTVNCVLPIVN